MQPKPLVLSLLNGCSSPSQIKCLLSRCAQLRIALWLSAISFVLHNWGHAVMLSLLYSFAFPSSSLEIHQALIYDICQTCAMHPDVHICGKCSQHILATDCMPELGG